jgi:penicillin-binding protein 2
VVSGLVREYPVSDVTAHLLGYVGPVSERELNGDPLLELPEFRIGKSGIEKIYDQSLRGRAGLSRYEVNALGREIKELQRRDGESGQELRLTVDLDLQRYVHGRLARASAAADAGRQTGEVLALAWCRLRSEAFANGLSRGQARPDGTRAPLVNKVIAGQYPGSTFKMIVALAARGLASSVRPRCLPGSPRSPTFHCWKQWGHIARLVAPSSSPATCTSMTSPAGSASCHRRMARRFGFGPLDIDLPGERRAGAGPAWAGDPACLAAGETWWSGSARVSCKRRRFSWRSWSRGSRTAAAVLPWWRSRRRSR